MNSIRQRIVASVLCIFSTLLLISPAQAQSSDGFTSLIDGVSLNGWNIVGTATWAIGNGLIVGSKPTGFLVSDQSYQNFIIRSEFWADSDTNSGIFIRCQDLTKIAAANAYEINIWDTRPEQAYATGAIVDVAKVNPVPKAGGRWNTMEIIANGSHFKVILNGVVTVADVQDSRFKSGPIAIQSAGSVIEFKKLQIKPL